MFCAAPNGTRISSFSLGDITVNVIPAFAEQNEAAFSAACRLESAPGIIAALRDELAQAVKRVQIQSAKPARLIGTGYIRFTEKGTMWLLSDRKNGWAAFGVICDSWDDLFRNYDVRVTGHGTDEFGLWWSVENFAPPRITASPR